MVDCHERLWTPTGYEYLFSDILGRRQQSAQYYHPLPVTSPFLALALALHLDLLDYTDTEHDG